MKNIYLIFLFFASIFLSSCDKVDEPYTSPVPAKDWYGKRILIEDYTGHKCPNCPSAAIIATNLKELYGDKIVVIAIHAGYFATPSSPNFPEDFRTTAGTEWDNFFGISNVGNPNGLINRVGFPTTTHVINPNAWAAKTGSILTEIPEVDIDITTSYSNSDRKLIGQVKTKFLKTTKKKLKLQIVITEDSIIAPQQNANTLVTNYVHCHVLRGDVNGKWGIDLTDGQTNTPINTELSQNILFALDPIWESKHCTVVAFVYDADTYEVLQVAEKHIE
ncbi:MAG: Omp28 family outer membrane lipoprotein [Bacteroidetes bacterium]|nr:Omp28 family outer membrane lipoprotein [Bacteroidota bacterium]